MATGNAPDQPSTVQPELTSDMASRTESRPNTGNEWSTDDEIVLQQTFPTEITVWDRTHECWGVSPPLAFPEGFGVNVDRNKPLILEDGRQLRNKNWPSTFCQHLASLVYCPAFRDDLQFFQRTVRYVHDRRVSTGKKRPSILGMIAPNDLIDGILKTLAECVSLGDKQGSDLMAIIEASKPQLVQFVKDELCRQANHHSLLDYIEVDRRDQREGIVLADLEAIEKAWTNYSSATDYRETDSPKKEQKKPRMLKGEKRSGVVLDMKRAFLIEQKQKMNLDANATSSSTSTQRRVVESSALESRMSSTRGRAHPRLAFVVDSTTPSSESSSKQQPGNPNGRPSTENAEITQEDLTHDLPADKTVCAAEVPSPQDVQASPQDSGSERGLQTGLPSQHQTNPLTSAADAEISRVLTSLKSRRDNMSPAWWRGFKTESVRQNFEKGLQEQQTRIENLPLADGHQLEEVREITAEIIARCKKYDEDLQTVTKPKSRKAVSAIRQDASPEDSAPHSKRQKVSKVYKE